MVHKLVVGGILAFALAMAYLSGKTPKTLLEKIRAKSAKRNGIRGSIQNLELIDIMQFPDLRLNYDTIKDIRTNRKTVKRPWGLDYPTDVSPLARYRKRYYDMIVNAKHTLTVGSMIWGFTELMGDVYIDVLATGLRDRISTEPIKVVIVLGYMQMLTKEYADAMVEKVSPNYFWERLKKGMDGRANVENISLVLQNDFTIDEPLKCILWSHSKYMIADGTEIIIGGANLWQTCYDSLDFFKDMYKDKPWASKIQAPVIDAMLRLRGNTTDLTRHTKLLVGPSVRARAGIEKRDFSDTTFLNDMTDDKIIPWFVTFFDKELELARNNTTTSGSPGYFVTKHLAHYKLYQYANAKLMPPNPSRSAMFAAMSLATKEFVIDGQEIISEFDTVFRKLERKIRKVLKEKTKEADSLFLDFTRKALDLRLFEGRRSNPGASYDRNDMMRNIVKMLKRGIQVKILLSSHANEEVEYGNVESSRDFVKLLKEFGATDQDIMNLEMKYTSYDNKGPANQHSKNWFVDQKVCYCGSENSYSSPLQQTGVILSEQACLDMYNTLFLPKWNRANRCDLTNENAACDSLITKQTELN